MKTSIIFSVMLFLVTTAVAQSNTFSSDEPQSLQEMKLESEVRMCHYCDSMRIAWRSLFYEQREKTLLTKSDSLNLRKNALVLAFCDISLCPREGGPFLKRNYAPWRQTEGRADDVYIIRIEN